MWANLKRYNRGRISCCFLQEKEKAVRNSSEKKSCTENHDPNLVKKTSGHMA